jgi:hypothetical protein
MSAAPCGTKYIASYINVCNRSMLTLPFSSVLLQNLHVTKVLLILVIEMQASGTSEDLYSSHCVAKCLGFGSPTWFSRRHSAWFYRTLRTSCEQASIRGVLQPHQGHEAEQRYKAEDCGPSVVPLPFIIPTPSRITMRRTAIRMIQCDS